MSRTRLAPLIALSGLMFAFAACGGTKPAATPGANPTPSSFPGSTSATPPSTPPAPPANTGETVAAPPTVAPPVAVDPLSNQSLDELNRNLALKPIFFEFNSDQLDDSARQLLTDNSTTLRKYGTWVITVEGHCDERGTAEYNLALGERRAQAVRNYLVSLGVQVERMRTISYGKEFPFDPGHDEGAWSHNRRAQLMVTNR